MAGDPRQGRAPGAGRHQHPVPEVHPHVQHVQHLVADRVLGQGLGVHGAPVREQGRRLRQRDRALPPAGDQLRRGSADGRAAGQARQGEPREPGGAAAQARVPAGDPPLDTGQPGVQRQPAQRQLTRTPRETVSYPPTRPPAAASSRLFFRHPDVRSALLSRTSAFSTESHNMYRVRTSRVPTPYIVVYTL